MKMLLFLIGLILLSGCIEEEIEECSEDRAHSFITLFKEEQKIEWEMGEQRLMFEAGKRLELDVLNKNYSFIENGKFVYPDNLLCEPHDCSRLTPDYKSYTTAICLVCDYNVILPVESEPDINKSWSFGSIEDKTDFYEK